MTSDDELEDFKTQIDLISFALSYGFEIDQRRSCRTSASLKHTNGDRILVSKETDGHYLFCSVRGDASGSVIDFVQWQSGGISLGLVRKELRPWLKGHVGISSSAQRRLDRQGLGAVPERLLASQVDYEAVQRLYSAATPLTGYNAFLSAQRGIPEDIYTHPAFAGRIRINEPRGNLLFPHWETGGKQLAGFEIKNHGFSGFARGGSKRLFGSKPGKDDNCLVIGEAVLDLLSYAAIHGIERTRFVSTAGRLNPHQPALLHSAMQRIPDGSVIVAAVDSDDGGDLLAEELKTIHASLGRPSVRFLRHSPEVRGQDWNDVLRENDQGQNDPPAQDML